jgi:hypothetical protein
MRQDLYVIEIEIFEEYRDEKDNSPKHGRVQVKDSIVDTGQRGPNGHRIQEVDEQPSLSHIGSSQGRGSMAGFHFAAHQNRRVRFILQL